MRTELVHRQTSPDQQSDALDQAVSQLEAWLETMRGPDGYGGPVAHWWQQGFIHTGPGLDWRYEGIIAGYLNLWERTGNLRWLAKAKRAGDDLLHGQLANGHFLASGFELNPIAGGTPHEAACDLALLELASALRSTNDPGWEHYLDAARRNLEHFVIGLLWSDETRSIHDGPREDTFVPNKAATACEALMNLAALSGDDTLVDRFVLPTLDRVLEYQVMGTRLDGAIAQNSIRGRRVSTCFPVYIARCVPALVRATLLTDDDRYLDAAVRAARFIERHVDAEGRLPVVIYEGGRATHGHSWIAALGDVLRAADILAANGVHIDLDPVREVLLAGQDDTGGIQTAVGFATLTGNPAAPPDVRDLLHVAGWCDKAFRYLTAHVSPALHEETYSAFTFDAECQLHGQVLRFCETHDLLEIRSQNEVRYRWRKGSPRPEVAAPEFWLR